MYAVSYDTDDGILDVDTFPVNSVCYTEKYFFIKSNFVSISARNCNFDISASYIFV